MEFRVLGPLEVVHDHLPVPVNGVRQRAILAFLVLHSGTYLTVGRLARALWEDEEPATARKVLQNGISRLRKALFRPAAALPLELRTGPQGYMLRVPAAALDSARHHELVATARRDLAERDFESASRHLGLALDLWRGDPLADLAEAGFAWPELAALRESRWQAVEDRIAAELVLGRDRGVIAELAVMTETDPTRERLCLLQMVALHRNGRSADALDVYRRTRSALTDHFQTAPGERLRRLEQDILMHRAGQPEHCTAELLAA
ncbi:AfsR/SARP family transcriptional regulator [Saccharothrix sp. Mg75]|uniref:AfsR/SARP family transcriptional regulator n=1 Tax=Saccharothrix sp. Mg75 TaxID=3445357 RepID=UPI003EE9CA58